MLFRDPQALGSTLAALGMLQSQAFRSLNRIDPLDSVSNYMYYIRAGSVSGVSTNNINSTSKIFNYIE